MRRSPIIAHRGFWLRPDEKNTPRAFARALSEGFGIETDVWDLGGDLVISHDPPQVGALLAEEFSTQCAAVRGAGLLALNIKADGLYALLARAAEGAGLETSRTLVFVMSVHDAREYRGRSFPVYERTSEYEPDPPLIASTVGVWLDNFGGAIDQVSAALKFLELDFSVDGMIISLYARGMTIRDIQHHLASKLGMELSHETISKITDQIADEVLAWQTRPLETLYPVIYLDAIIVKVRDGGHVRNKAAHIAVGVDMDGVKHVLGIWVQATEGAKFWAAVCAELANRGVKDVLIVCCYAVLAVMPMMVGGAVRGAGVRVPAPETASEPALGRPNDSAAVVGDATRLRDEFGWRPEVDWKQSIRDFVNSRQRDSFYQHACRQRPT